MGGFAFPLSHWDSLLPFVDNKLQARQATREDLPKTDALFRQVARGKIGFARRHEPFMSTMVEIGDVMSLDDLRVLWLDNDVVGYAVVRNSEDVFKVNDILLRDGTDSTAASAALLHESEAPYVQVTMNNHSPHLEDLRQANFRVSSSTWDVVMVRPLTDAMTADELRTAVGIGSDRYMMSWMDVT